MNCPTCGKEYEDSITYCGICGTYLHNGNVDNFVEVPRNNPIWAIQAGFRNYFNFNARATRAEYWWWVLFSFVVFTIVLVGYFMSEILGTILLYFWLGIILILYFPLSIRRLHDSGKSAWWLLLNAAPFGGIVLLVFMCLSSDYANKYGPDPRIIGK